MGAFVESGSSQRPGGAASFIRNAIIDLSLGRPVVSPEAEHSVTAREQRPVAQGPLHVLGAERGDFWKRLPQRKGRAHGHLAGWLAVLGLGRVVVDPHPVAALVVLPPGLLVNGERLAASEKDSNEEESHHSRSEGLCRSHSIFQPRLPGSSRRVQHPRRGRISGRSARDSIRRMDRREQKEPTGGTTN